MKNNYKKIVEEQEKVIIKLKEENNRLDDDFERLEDYISLNIELAEKVGENKILKRILEKILKIDLEDNLFDGGDLKNE